MARNILGISWLNGRFEAVTLVGRQVSASWISPQPVLTDADFAPALVEAVKHTRFRGHQVSVLLDHRSLLFHVQETPPAKGRMLRQLLERLVAQNQSFQEQASWGHIALPALKGRQRFLLALLPRSLACLLNETCAAQKLHLAAVLPLAAVLGEQLKRLSAPADEILILAVDLGGSLQLLLGRGDGQVLFSRSVVVSSAQQSERAAQEINRTLHYAQQQFGAVVNQLFVFGEQAFAGLKDMEIRQGLRIQPSPIVPDPLFFAKLAAAASSKSTLNLASGGAPAPQRTRHLMAAGLAALLLISTAIAARVEMVVRATEQRFVQSTLRLGAAAESQALEQSRAQEANRLQALLILVGGTNEPPVPELFARYLAATLPEPMRLNQFTVTRGMNGWEFRLEGFASERTGGFLGLLDRFENDLRTNLFRVRITDSTHRRLFGGATSTHPELAPNGARTDEKTFFVSGVIP